MCRTLGVCGPDDDEVKATTGATLAHRRTAVEATVGESELAELLEERSGGGELLHAVVGGVGHFVGFVSDAIVGYDASAPPLDQSSVEAIHFLVASMEAGPVAFGFCISNLQIQ